MGRQSLLAGLCAHYSSEDDKKPETHYFEDEHEMLAHVAQHSYVPEPSEEEGR
jgi:hypothetical protein